MSLVQDILRTTAKYYPMGYKDLYEHLYGETIYGKKLNRNSLQATLSRMKKEGLLSSKNRRWGPTSDGVTFLKKSGDGIKKFFKRENVLGNREKLRKLIIIFDIPEKKKKYREWLRTELVGFGFNLVQKSVWFGPGLPKEFIEYLSESGILKHIRFFKATEKDLI